MWTPKNYIQTCMCNVLLIQSSGFMKDSKKRTYNKLYEY